MHVYGRRKEKDYVEEERIQSYTEGETANEENRVTEESDEHQKMLLAKRKRTFAHIHVNS